MKLNRKWLLVIALVLSMSMAIGGTLAYLQDTDTDVNVMTLGSVHIEQIEQEWNADKTELQEFTQGKPLYPYVGTLGWENKEADNGAYRRFTMNNVVDKYVSVENTGKSDAYVRTIIALEQGNLTYAELSQYLGASINHANGSEFKFDGAWTWEEIETVKIGDNNYNIMIATHANAVKAGETTIPSLLQVYLSKDAGNEEVEKIDGNGNGMYDILVLSQAIQTEGFEATDSKTAAQVALEAGFGEANAENVAKWFGGVVPVQTASTAAELTAALANGGSVVLTEDVTMDSDANITIAKGASATLDLAGHTLTGSSATTGKNRNLVTVKGDLTVVGGTVKMTHTGENMGWNNLVSAFSVEGGELTLDGVTITASGSDMAYGVDVNTTLGETVLNIEGNTSITSSYTGVRIFNNHKTATGTINLNSGTITGTSRDIWVHNPSANAVDANGIVNFNNGAEYEMTVQDNFFNSRIYQIN